MKNTPEKREESVSVVIKEVIGTKERVRGAIKQSNSCFCDRSVGTPRTGDGSDPKLIS